MGYVAIPLPQASSLGQVVQELYFSLRSRPLLVEMTNGDLHDIILLEKSKKKGRRMPYCAVKEGEMNLSDGPGTALDKYNYSKETR